MAALDVHREALKWLREVRPVRAFEAMSPAELGATVEEALRHAEERARDPSLATMARPRR